MSKEKSGYAITDMMCTLNEAAFSIDGEKPSFKEYLMEKGDYFYRPDWTVHYNKNSGFWQNYQGQESDIYPTYEEFRVVCSVRVPEGFRSEAPIVLKRETVRHKPSFKDHLIKNGVFAYRPNWTVHYAEDQGFWISDREDETEIFDDYDAFLREYDLEIPEDFRR